MAATSVTAMATTTPATTIFTGTETAPTTTTTNDNSTTLTSPTSTKTTSTTETHSTRSERFRRLKATFRSLLAYYPHYECEYCCEEVPRAPAFLRAYARRGVPPNCRPHLQDVCTPCVTAALRAQLADRPLLKLGCPACAAVWRWHELKRFYGVTAGGRGAAAAAAGRQRRLLGLGGRRQQLGGAGSEVDLAAMVGRVGLLGRGQAFVPACLPEEETLVVMLEEAVRLCPWCRYPFCKDGGCDHMLCKFGCLSAALFAAMRWLLMHWRSQAATVNAHSTSATRWYWRMVMAGEPKTCRTAWRTTTIRR